MAENYWLIKSEPIAYSIDRLAKDQTAWWEGVRNYQARNFMMKEMKPGDPILFYHSNASPSGVAGLAKVSKSAQPDPTQFDKKSDYYDPKSSRENPRWHCVELCFVEKFRNFLSLDLLKKTSGLEKMLLFQKGQRLSIQPVTAADFSLIQKLSKAKS